MSSYFANNNNNTWSSTIRGNAVKGNKLLEYKLEILAVQDSVMDSLFNYSIHPVSLTVKESFLPKDYSSSASSYSAQKAASSVSSQIDD